MHDRDYLDLPVIDTDIRIDIEQNYQEHIWDDWNNEADEYESDNSFSIYGLSDKSFLKKMGYDTSVSEKKRQEILDIAISRFGKRRIRNMQ